MNSEAIVALLGETSEDEAVKAFLRRFEIVKRPQLNGDETAIVGNKQVGVEMTFRDARQLDVDVPSKKYKKGALVLSNVRFYGGDKSYERFAETLPYGLTFEMDKKQAFAAVGKKPAKDNKETAKARWDFKGHCLFVTFDKQSSVIRIVALQLPLE